MRNGKKLLLLGALVLAVGIGILAYSRSSQQTEVPPPETATTPVETTSEILPGGEVAPAAPTADPGSDAQPPSTEPVPENGVPAPQTPN